MRTYLVSFDRGYFTAVHGSFDLTLSEYLDYFVETSVQEVTCILNSL